MKNLELKIKNTSTENLVSTFKGLGKKIGESENLVNELVMKELENRMNETEFCNLLDEVYED